MSSVRPLSSELWKQKCSHQFSTRLDTVRSLLVVHHPWVPSRAGGFGEWTAQVTPPTGWRPGDRLFLSFYQSDNYVGTQSQDAWTGTQAFNGHRFKQVLVNGQLVWEQDVADAAMVDPMDQPEDTQRSGYPEPYRVVEITPHATHKMTVTLRGLDKVASTTKLPDDVYKRFSWSSLDPRKAIQNFHTTLYFGDVHLTLDDRVVRPKDQALRVRPRGRTRPRALPAAGIPFILVSSDRLPVSGYPVRSGVPMPQGVIRPGTPVALHDPRGQTVPFAATELSHWPDGSVRWLLCEFVANHNGRYRLLPGGDPTAPQQPVFVATNDAQTTVTNGVLTLRVGQATGSGIFDGLSLTSGFALGEMDLSVKLNRVGWRDHFTAQRQRVLIERSNPVCAIIRVEGDLVDEKGQRFGPWRARLHIWAGVPYLLADWRLVNETDQAIAMLLDWSAHIRLPDVDNAVVDFGPFTPGFDRDDIGIKAVGHRSDIQTARNMMLYNNSELSCRQERVGQARLYRNTSWVATTEQATGHVHLQHPEGSVVGAMQWFAEEYPKGIVVRPDRLILATLPESPDALGWAHDRPFVHIGRGEAKRQTFALWLQDKPSTRREAERFNHCVQDAPRLLNQEWFIASGALDAGPPRDTPGLSAWAEAIAPVIERTGIGAPRLGHREYWDTAWGNDYRGRTHQALLQHIETGDRRWYRYFDAACTHNRDVDGIHFCPEHPDWVGFSHLYSEDHTSSGPMVGIGLNCDGLLDHYLMTGDPDSREAVEGRAIRLLDANPWERSARNIGWPLSQAIRWYDQTGDRRFLDKARDLVAAARAYIEPRRGVFFEIHGSYNYVGTVPFMTGYLAFGLVRYHQSTGDAGALRLLNLLAVGLFSESRTAYGRFQLSPFPEINYATDRSRGYNAMIGGLAGYLFHVTGDDLYKAWASECYDTIVERSDDAQVTMDMLPLAGWMLFAVTRG